MNGKWVSDKSEKFLQFMDEIHELYKKYGYEELYFDWLNQASDKISYKKQEKK
jgi:hypothetical protein